MKLTNADLALSKCIRERNNWICERCSFTDTDGQATGGSKRIHHSHFIGRKHKSTRYMAENGLALCAKCHSEVEENPYEHTKLFVSIMGEGMAELLSEKKHVPFKPVGGSKAYEKEAAAHYRSEYKRMRELRAEGKTGRIEFDSFE